MFLQSCSNVCYLRGSDSDSNGEFISSDGINKKYIILPSRKFSKIKKTDAILLTEDGNEEVMRTILCANFQQKQQGERMS